MQVDTDPHLVLLSLRNTPVTGLDMWPAQMLMGRALCSTLPCSSASLKQSIPWHVYNRIHNLQSHQRLYFDRKRAPADATGTGTSHCDRPETGATLLWCSDSWGKDFVEEQETSAEDTSGSIQAHWLGWGLWYDTLSDTRVYSPATPSATTTGSTALKSNGYTAESRSRCGTVDTSSWFTESWGFFLLRNRKTRSDSLLKS